MSEKLTVTKEIEHYRDSTAPADHCDWCGDELGAVRYWVSDPRAGDMIRVHQHCITEATASRVALASTRKEP